MFSSCMELRCATETGKSRGCDNADVSIDDVQDLELRERHEPWDDIIEGVDGVAIQSDEFDRCGILNQGFSKLQASSLGSKLFDSILKSADTFMRARRGEVLPVLG